MEYDTNYLQVTRILIQNLLDILPKDRHERLELNNILNLINSGNLTDANLVYIENTLDRLLEKIDAALTLSTLDIPVNKEIEAGIKKRKIE